MNEWNFKNVNIMTLLFEWNTVVKNQCETIEIEIKQNCMWEANEENFAEKWDGTRKKICH